MEVNEMEEKKFCKYCGESIDADALVCPKCGKKLEGGEGIVDEVPQGNQPKWLTVLTWIALIFCPVIGIILLWTANKEYTKKSKVILTLIFMIWTPILYSSNDNSSDTAKVAKNNAVKVEVADFSTMSVTEASSWCTNNKLNCNIASNYSDTVAKGALIKQSEQAGTSISEGSDVIIRYSLGKEPSMEFKNALASAERYSETLHMSKSAIFSQLTSEYGGGFPKDAAQYAVDNLKADYKYNALQSAKNYSETLHMSKKAIFDQLISEYGGKFTREEAQYAIDNLDE